MDAAPRYIVVDLDGTLVRGDLFVQTALSFLVHNPFRIFHVLLWVWRGRSAAKTMIARHISIEAENLPYEPELVEYLQKKKAEGYSIVLATAAHRRHANAVARHLGFFDEVIASNARSNNKGDAKLAAIRARIGKAAFVYAGDSMADCPLCLAAQQVIYVNPSSRLLAWAVANDKTGRIINSRPPKIRAFLKEMRLHQWAKNILVFLPLAVSHNYTNPAMLQDAVLAFFAFSLCASGVYLLNDLVDLDADRRHPRKRFRPLASGELSPLWGIAGAIVLPLAAFAIALGLLNSDFVAILGIYYVLTCSYSFYLKRVSTVDFVCLAVLYTLRVLAGAFAVDLTPSFFLLGFSMFFFAGLALLKRYVEYRDIEVQVRNSSNRGYSAEDREAMFSLGVANSTASVVILAFYISGSEVISHYSSPSVLWLLCLLALFWTNRIWLGARRGKINDDPLVFAMRDRVSWLTAISGILVVLVGRYVSL